jgi:RNA polymerase sigma-70 factor (ECF subfamily)
MQRTTHREDAFRAKEDRLRALLMRGLAGENSDYQLFLTELSAHLRAFLRRRLIQLPDEVEDLVQEALLAVHNQRHTYDPRQPLSAWVQAIARYKLVDLLRRRAGQETLNDPLDEAMAVFSSSDTEAAEARRDLNKLLADLPEQQRLPIVHTKLEGLSVKETAELTGMSESAIKVGVHRGLKALALKIKGLL